MPLQARQYSDKSVQLLKLVSGILALTK